MMTVIVGYALVEQELLTKIQYMKYTCVPFDQYSMYCAWCGDRRLVVANLKDYEPSLHMQTHGTRKTCLYTMHDNMILTEIKSKGWRKLMDCGLD